MPRLQVLAGPSPSSLVPISKFVNSTTPHTISSDTFDGQILVHIKGFTGPDGNILDSEYFSREDKAGITWSIQVQGKFLQPHTADDILFGNTFDKPLKLPWGSTAALKFMQYIDPTLDHDLTSSTRPWALSPLIATMPNFAHRRITQHYSAPDPLKDPSSQSNRIPPYPPPVALFPPPTSIEDDTSELYLALIPSSGFSSTSASPSSSPSSSIHASPSSSQTSLSLKSTPDGNHHKRSSPSLHLKPTSSAIIHKRSTSNSQKIAATLIQKESVNKQLFTFSTPSQRRAYFADAHHRQSIEFGPQDMITLDFCYGFLEFSPALALRLPGGISFDLLHYWDGQPVRFVCCERRKHSSDDVQEGEETEPWGNMFWCVSIEMADDDEPQKSAELDTSNQNDVD